MTILKTLSLLAAVVPVAISQTLTVDNTTIEANSSTVSPGAELTSATSNNTSEYFEDEALQLTDSVLANLTDLDLSAIDLFAFGDDSNSTNSTTAKRSTSCRYMPGDWLYPSTLVWKVFDLLIGGALLKPAPLAAACYDDHPESRDEELCSYISANWENNSYIHSDDPTSVMWPLFQGRTCMPTDDSTDSCTQGAYPEYVVNATNVAQIQLAVNFARNANLRLVVKNTGHSFIGKSAGAGALSIWTHNMKSIKYYSNYRYGSYSGAAFKLGAGVQADEVYAAAYSNGVTAMGGEGRSVGVAGGFIAGGGHSPLSSLYGMVADHVLSMEVVTPDGRFVTASEYVNSDLFWALRGGGGGTFGVVTSVVVKAFPKMEVSTLEFGVYSGTGNVTVDMFWQGVKSYLSYLPTFVDAGCYAYFSLVKISDEMYYFGMAPFFAPTMSLADLKKLTSPWLTEMAEIGIEIDPTWTHFDDFYNAWDGVFPLETVGSTTMKTASRLFPRANFENTEKFNATVDAIQEVVEAGIAVLAFNIAGVGIKTCDYPDNAVNPAWRKTVLHAITATFWDEDATDDEIAAASKALTVDYMGKWRDVSAGAGSYMSEGDVDEPNFQQSFYGSKYSKLYKLKQKYDPSGLFYAPTAVGSEDWYITDQIDYLTTQNGRLCKA